MKCRTSRLISTLLALCLAPALLPGTALAEEMDRIYGEYYYRFYNKKQEVFTEYTEEQAIQRAKIAENIALWI